MGDGEHRKIIESYAEKNGVANLSFEGNRKNIADYYKKSKILCMTSAYEGWPMVLAEAMAYGCVPVSFNQGGQADIISHLSTGFLAQYDDNLETRARNLANGIIWAVKMASDPDSLKEIRLRMKKSVEDKFSYKKIVKAYISLIQKAQQDLATAERDRK